MNESILPAGVADVALILAQWPALQAFYLAGGTALALLKRASPVSRSHLKPGASLPQVIARVIVIQKAYTIGGRAQARNYLDMHEALTSNVLSLKSLIEHAKHIYGENFSTRLFLQQLAYTQDLPDKDAAVALLTVPRTFESVERDLQILVRHYVQDTMTTHSVRRPRGPGL